MKLGAENEMPPKEDENSRRETSASEGKLLVEQKESRQAITNAVWSF